MPHVECKALLKLSTIVMLTICAFPCLAQLSPIGSAISSGGIPSSAKFYVGASSGTGGYKNNFSSQELLSVQARIEVENSHVGGSGQVFVVVQANGELFLKNKAGDFQVWNGSVPTLVENSEEAILGETVDLTVLSELELAPLNLAGTRIDIYLGYSVKSTPDTIYYSSTPFEIHIDEYQPLVVQPRTFQTLDILSTDLSREREIPTLVYVPENTAPVILFSHGLGGTRFAATYLFEHFASRGYVVVSMQHPGSDSSIYQGLPANQILAAFNQAATAANLLLRIGDVSSVLDQLEIWNADPDHLLYQRIDLDRIGMSGHSFGARTTQATSGESVLNLGDSTLESRIKAAIPYSTSVPGSESPEDLLAGAKIPWLVMTGTNDVALVGNTSLQDRLAVFPALPANNKYELVLFGGEHNAFTDNTDTDSENYNPAHHPTITALSTAFWDAYLLGNLSALTWLQGEGARSVLSEGDSWQFK